MNIGNIGNLKSSFDSLSSGDIRSEFNKSASANGLGSSDTSNISSELDYVFSTGLSLDSINLIYDDTINDIKNRVSGLLGRFRSAQMTKSQQQSLHSYEIQNAKASIALHPPMISKSLGNIPKFEPVDYSSQEDYPESTGIINTIKAWIKINKKKKSVEMVHPSTSRFQIDKDGNILEYNTGSRVIKVDKDLIYEVGGNLSILVNGQKLEIIKKSSTEKIEGSMQSTIGKTLTETVQGSVTEKYGGTHNTSCGGTRAERAPTINHN